MNQDGPYFEIETAPLGSFEDRIWLIDDKMVWMGWRDAEGWHDCAEYAGDNKSLVGTPTRPHWYPRHPLYWQPRLPENTVPLPEEKDHAGQQLLEAVDEDELPIQGAMWVHGHLGWKYFLVTPDAELVQKILPEIFRSGRISQAMIIDDIEVVDPNNRTFQFFVKSSKRPGTVDGHRTEFRGDEHRGAHTADDGTILRYWHRPNAVVYRALKTVDGSDFNRPERMRNNDDIQRNV